MACGSVGRTGRTEAGEEKLRGRYSLLMTL